MASSAWGRVEFGPPKTIVPESENTRLLRSVVLPIITVERDGRMHAIGTCFVVSPTGNQALALTAKHNIDYVLRIDGVRDASAPSTPPEFRRVRPGRQTFKNVKPFAAYWSSDERVIACDILEVWSAHTGHDVAVLLLKIPDHYGVQFTRRLKIDSHGPRIGEAIRGIGYRAMAVGDQRVNENGTILQQELTLPVEVVEGIVIQSYGVRQHRLLKWPCIEMNCSFDPGMSGGPVFIVGGDGAVVAVGMITSGVSYAAEGMASLLHPALMTRLYADPVLGVGKKPTLVDCVRAGLIADVAEAHKHLRDDGSWSDKELTDVELANFNDLPRGGYVVAETETPMHAPVEFLSPDCARLGRINQINGDDAEFFVISSEICEILRSRGEPNAPVTNVMRFVRAEMPYVWFEVGDAQYRFFVFGVEGERHPPVKIFTDACRNGSSR